MQLQLCNIFRNICNVVQPNGAQAKKTMNDKSLIISKLIGGRTALLIVTISLSAMLCACSEDEPPQPTAKPAEPPSFSLRRRKENPLFFTVFFTGHFFLAHPLQKPYLCIVVQGRNLRGNKSRRPRPSARSPQELNY